MSNIHKSIVILSFVHFFYAGFIPAIFAIDKSAEPKAVFSAVFWENYKSESFSYAPWGNEGEANASMAEISVGSSSLSRKFVYYGTGKINFYEKRRPREWETEDGNDSIRQPLGKLAAEFELPQGKEGMQSFLLLFVNKKKNGLWKIYPIPFSENEVPLGSYNFISQSRNPLYLIFGNEKFTLPSGKSKVCPAVLGEGTRGVLLKVMIQKNGQYLEVFNQKFGHSPTMRGMFFLGFDREKLTVKRVAQFEQSISSASGFGLSRLQGDIEREAQTE